MSALSKLSTAARRALCLAGACALLWAFAMLQQWLAGAASLPTLALVPPALALPADARWLSQAQGFIPMPIETPSAHASNLLVMPGGHPAALTAFWFAGERESAPNVQIAASQWLRASQRWTPARWVVNRHAMAAQLGFGVRRLGNPVAWLDGQGRMHLFVVATGAGGWAASRILHLRQSGDSTELAALRFEPVGVLPLAWLWNTSYLVRNAPVPLADGGMLLPVHFELGLKHAATLRFDAAGNYLGMLTMTPRLGVLQPSVVALSATEALAFMRVQRNGGKVAMARTQDAGAHWINLPDTHLDNPDAAVAALALGPSRVALVHNASPAGRQDLALSESIDMQNWVLTRALSRGPAGSEFSYPALALADGQLWVSFTDNRQRIAWQRFAPAP